MVLLNPRTPTKKITIQQNSQSQSGTGMLTDTWTTYADRYAAIKTQGGQQGLVAAQVFGQRTIKFILDYDSMVGAITTKMRILWGTRTFDIMDVENIDEENREVVLTGKERNV